VGFGKCRNQSAKKGAFTSKLAKAFIGKMADLTNLSASIQFSDAISI
jgi:hypothetical protein